MSDNKPKFYDDNAINEMTSKMVNKNNNIDTANLKSTSTDLMVEQLAASCKLIPEDDRKYYEPGNKNSVTHLDDNIDDIIGGSKNKESGQNQDKDKDKNEKTR